MHRILERDVSLDLVPLQDTFYSRYLTCPVKALDFLSHGLPIVASELPSTREVLQSAASYCSSTSATEFAQSVEELLENSQIYAAASQKSHERNALLLWHLRAEKILRFCLG